MDQIQTFLNLKTKSNLPKILWTKSVIYPKMYELVILRSNLGSSLLGFAWIYRKLGTDSSHYDYNTIL